jgi:16S rRNA (uracil1498-N3)-methyltransferase
VSARLDPPYAALRHGAPLAVDERVTLDAGVAAGLRFRKVNVKEAFTLVDSTGRYFRAALEALTVTEATALVYEEMRVVPESPAFVTLVCAVLQRQRMLWVAQKAAELGVARIQPVFTLKSVQAEGLAHEKVHAWPGQALKGARQCRRASVPEVLPAVALDAVLSSERWHEATVRVFLDDRADEHGIDILTPHAQPEVMLVVGPEGGFAHVERARLTAAGASPLRLGGRVLRAETAVAAGLVVVQHRLGDMGSEAAEGRVR